MEGDEFSKDTAEVLVFHPHGFLPRDDYTGNYSDQPIILSEDDYHQLYASPYSWPNVIQLHLLMSFSALFVGCSLTDPNMRRLLDVCKKTRVAHKHFALMKEPTYKSEKGWYGRLNSHLLKEVENDALNDRGVTPIWFDEYSDVPKILHEIR